MTRLLLLLVCLLVGCASPPGTLVADDPVGSSDREASLGAFEQQIEDAVSRRDHVFLDGVTAPTFVRTNHEGKVEDRAAVMALIRQPPPSSVIIRRTIDPAKQRIELHGDVAIARGELEVRGPRRAYRTTYLRLYRQQGSAWQLLSDTTLSVTPLTP